MKKYISYKDDETNEIIKGIFEVIEETPNYIKIKTKSNILTIPYLRILKIKEKLKGGKD